MSFPSIIEGNPGDQRKTSLSPLDGNPLGTILRIGECEFTHARIGGTAMVAGRLYQSASAHVGVADTMLNKGLIPAAVYAVGATTVAFTIGGTTAITTNLLKDGYLYTASSTGGGIGYAYKIKSNNSAAAGSTTCTVVLYESDGLQAATEAATTRFGISVHPFNACELTMANTVGSNVAGVSCATAAASSYVWLQRKGPAAVYTGGTVLLQRSPSVCSTAVAGAIVPIAVAATTALLNTKEGFQVIGIGMNAAEITGFSMVDLCILP